MCKNEYEVKMQAMDLMSAAINDVVCAMPLMMCWKIRIC